MKKWGFIAVLLVVLAVIGVWNKQIMAIGYGWWARTVIYPGGSTITKYPGSGEIVEPKDETVFVIPKGVGRPVVVAPEVKSQYSAEQYDFVTLPAQESLLYTVARFQGWKEIPGSRDKYIVVKNPLTGTQSQYRIGFEPSKLFGYDAEDTTRLSVENIRIDGGTGENAIGKPIQVDLAELGYDVLKKVLRWGDAVVLLPVFSPPDWSKRDEAGHYTVSWLTVRRLDGTDMLNKELARWGVK